MSAVEIAMGAVYGIALLGVLYFTVKALWGVGVILAEWVRGLFDSPPPERPSPDPWNMSDADWEAFKRDRERWMDENT